MKFSLCHTTRRLENRGWLGAHDAWIGRAEHPGDLEYILCADSPVDVAGSRVDRFVLNTGRPCAVDGWNAAAAASTGDFLITVADDWFPCERWDTELLQVIPSLDGDYVVEVDTAGNPGLLTFSMLTRAYYNRYGYVFHPDFLGMLADNWFTDVARRDGVVIDARHLQFPHLHPAYGTAPNDDTYAWQHRQEAWDAGYSAYHRLRMQEFGFDPLFPNLEVKNELPT